MKLNVLNKNFFDLLFPSYCLGCERSNVLVCKDCLGELSFAEQICFVCKSSSQKGFTHDICKVRINSANYPVRLLSACHYQSSLIADMISALKYDGMKELAEPCAEIIYKFLSSKHISFSNEWTITCVPIDARKRNVRGFNQSELIAKELAIKLNLPFKNVLCKIKGTKAQMDLKRTERQINLNGAFKATTKTNAKIILFDDVITTGSTLLESSRALCDAGAKEICWLTLARD